MIPMEFRPRNYASEEESHSLSRVPADNHPLSPPSPSHLQVDAGDHGKNVFYDPLRGSDANAIISLDDLQDEDKSSAVNEADFELPTKGWTSFKKFLMQRFSGSKMVSISPVSDVIMKSGQVREKASTTMHLEELDDPQKFAEDGLKVISQQVYVSRLHELKDEIKRAWQANDRVTSLALAIKVARLLMDTSVLQFYPTLFVLATDVMDMVGEMVWQRIKQKAEFSEDGNKTLKQKISALMPKRLATTGSSKLVPSGSFFHAFIWSWQYCLAGVSWLTALLMSSSAW